MHYQLGRSWLKKGVPQKAIAPLGRAHQIMPDIIAATIELTKAMSAAGKKPEALLLLNAEIKRLNSPQQLVNWLSQIDGVK